MKRAVVLFAEGFEEIEGVTPADLLARGGVEVICAGVGSSVVRGAGGISVACDCMVSELSGQFDAVVLPGGMPGAANLAASKKVLELIDSAWQKGAVIAAICAAPAVVLAPMGILDDQEATCYPGFESKFNESTRFSEKGVVHSGQLITARGPGKAYAFGLEILRSLAGDDVVLDVSASSLYH